MKCLILSDSIASFRTKKECSSISLERSFQKILDIVESGNDLQHLIKK